MTIREMLKYYVRKGKKDNVFVWAYLLSHSDSKGNISIEKKIFRKDLKMDRRVVHRILADGYQLLGGRTKIVVDGSPDYITLNVKGGTKKSKAEKLEEKDGFTFSRFVEQFNQITDREFKGDQKARRQFRARRNEGYTEAEFEKAIINCFNSQYHKENPNHLTPEFITRSSKLEKYLHANRQGTSPKQGKTSKLNNAKEVLQNKEQQVDWDKTMENG